MRCQVAVWGKNKVCLSILVLLPAKDVCLRYAPWKASYCKQVQHKGLVAVALGTVRVVSCADRPALYTICKLIGKVVHLSKAVNVEGKWQSDLPFLWNIFASNLHTFTYIILPLLCILQGIDNINIYIFVVNTGCIFYYNSRTCFIFACLDTGRNWNY